MAIQLSLTCKELSHYLCNQFNSMFPDNQTFMPEDVLAVTELAIQRIEYCFSHIGLKYYREEGNPIFNHLNSDQFAMFVYIFSHVAYKDFQNETLATKAFYLNKVMHGLDCFYTVELPQIFLFVHPVGTVIGHGQFGDYFTVYQNCTVGSQIDGKYPNFKGQAVLYSGASVIGDCTVGDNVIFGAGCIVIGSSVESNSIVVGTHPQNRILKNTRSIRADIYKHI